MAKFTFKKQKREIWHDYDHFQTYIKHEKCIVGVIKEYFDYAGTMRCYYYIKMCVKQNPGEILPYRFVLLDTAGFNNRFDTEEEARKYLNENVDNILAKFSLYYEWPGEEESIPEYLRIRKRFFL